MKDEFEFFWRALRWKRLVAGDAFPHEEEEVDLLLLWGLRFR